MKHFPNDTKPDPVKKIESLGPTVRKLVGNVISSRFPQLSSEKNDICQEVMIALLKNPERLNFIEEIEPYIRSIAKNKCYDQVVKWKKKETVSMELAPDTPTDEGQETGFTLEHSKLIHKVLDSLKARKPECFQLFRKYYFIEEPLTHKKIAEEQHESVDAIKKRSERCHEEMRKIISLKKEYEDLLFFIPPSKREKRKNG